MPRCRRTNPARQQTGLVRRHGSKFEDVCMFSRNVQGRPRQSRHADRDRYAARTLARHEAAHDTVERAFVIDRFFIRPQALQEREIFVDPPPEGYMAGLPVGIDQSARRHPKRNPTAVPKLQRRQPARCGNGIEFAGAVCQQKLLLFDFSGDSAVDNTKLVALPVGQPGLKACARRRSGRDPASDCMPFSGSI